MKLVYKNTYFRLALAIAIAAILMITFAFSIGSVRRWRNEQVLSRVDYRIFACGEEIFVKPDSESPVGKGEGLFGRSEQGSIVAKGKPRSVPDVTLPAYFSAVGGKLEFPTESESTEIFSVPTTVGMREFRSSDQCNGKKASLHVLYYRVDAGTKPWSVFKRILWKYPDYVLQNNYGKVPPGDCLIFLFDSEDALERPWPSCVSLDKAIADGGLILKE
ncbi:MAG: hypothetical protein WC745_03090 [Patescibacteria group bacterium]|jgi:hypothetical protein